MLSAENDLKQVVYQVLVINGEQYALPVNSISRVSDLKNLLPLPGTPRWLSGVMLSRNVIVPVINLNELIGVESASASLNPFSILIRHPAESQRSLALCVSDVADLMVQDEIKRHDFQATTHSCIDRTIEHQAQKIHLLDINRLFEFIVQEHD